MSKDTPNAAILAEELAAAIPAARIKHLAQNNSRWMPKNFYASGIPECDRQLVHSILDWDKKPLPEAPLLSIFDAGKAEESRITRILSELGYEVIAQQNPIQIKHPKTGEIICTGKIDGKILYKGIALPCEIKSMGAHIFSGINSLADFEKRPHLRKYLRQLQLYLYGNNIEAGLFVISDFRSIPKVIPVYLDYGECERILKQLERAWIHVKNKTYPEPISYQPDICDNCPFEFLCTKTTCGKGAEFLDSKELEDNVARWLELKPLNKEFEQLDDAIKKPLKDKGILNAVIGTKYQIVGRMQKKAKYDTNLLTDEERESIKSEIEFPIYKIAPL